MPCVVCSKPDTETKYRCPKCASKYCSVPCFRSHKEACPQILATTDPKPTPTTLKLENSTPTTIASTGEPGPIDCSQNLQFDKILQNSRVQELLQYESVDKLLGLIVQIMHDPRVSGELSQEGRKIVALKKIRELRKGGREANEAIEELAELVNQLQKDQEE